MRWYVHALIKWIGPRTLEKMYFAQLHNGRRGHCSRRWFRTASQAKEYAGRWCERVNRMAELVEGARNAPQRAEVGNGD